MYKKSLRDIFYNTCALGGLYLAGALILTIVITSFIFSPNTAIILSVIISIFSIGIMMGNKFKAKINGTPVSFGRALSLLLLMLILSGIVIGVVVFVMCNIIAPEVFAEVFAIYKEEIILQVESPDDIIAELDMIYDSIKNPVTVVFSSIFSLLFFGSFPALFTATFIKTRTNTKI